MNTIDKNEFLKLCLLDDKKLDWISSEYGIGPKVLSEWWNTRDLELHKLIQKSNQIFSSKKSSSDFNYFEERGKRKFFDWYRKQPRVCGYCKIEEEKLKELFDGDKPFLETKRHRGKSLEFERKDTKDGKNVYNEENCILACYLCNNHKSDLISEKDFITFFAKNIREYLEAKYDEMKSR